MVKAMYLDSNLLFVNDSRFLAVSIDWCKASYKRLRAIFGQAIALALVIPVIILLHLVLKMVIWKLRRHSYKNVIVDSSNYEYFKKQQQELALSTQKLLKFKKIKRQKAPFLLQGIVRKIGKIVLLVESNKKTLDQKLKALDAGRRSTNGFDYLNEGAVWQGRQPVYEYLL